MYEPLQLRIINFIQKQVRYVGEAQGVCLKFVNSAFCMGRCELIFSLPGKPVSYHLWATFFKVSWPVVLGYLAFQVQSWDLTRQPDIATKTTLALNHKSNMIPTRSPIFSSGIDHRTTHVWCSVDQPPPLPPQWLRV